jgi:hypothetical protein
MATWSHTGGSTGHPETKRMPYLVNQIVDFAVIAAKGTIGTTDTIQVIKVPAGTVCLGAGFEVLKAETVNTSAQAELGDGSDPNRYVVSRTLTSLTDSAVVISTGAVFVYDTADTIDLLLSVDDPTNAKVRVWAILCDLTDVETTDNHTWSSA